MKVELELPDELVEELYRESNALDIPPETYLAELVYQHLAGGSLGADGLLDSRPDWQAALLRSREDWATGRTVGHQEVEAWHHRRRD
jgi:hypothetical protein